MQISQHRCFSVALCQAPWAGELAKQPKRSLIPHFTLLLCLKKGLICKGKMQGRRGGPKNHPIQCCVWLRAFSYREALPQPELSKAAARSSNWSTRLLALSPYVGDQAFWCWFVLVLLHALKKKKRVKANKKPSKFRYTEGKIFTLVQIKLRLPSA